MCVCFFVFFFVCFFFFSFLIYILYVNVRNALIKKYLKKKKKNDTGFYYNSGGPRVGVRGARASPLVLDQTEVRRRADKKFFWDGPILFQDLNDSPPTPPPPPPPYLKVWILHCIVHHKSLKSCILKSLLLLYCFWDILSENRHREPGLRLRRMRMSQSGIRTSMFPVWKKAKPNSHHPLLFYFIVERILCINHKESLFWTQRLSWIL